MKITIRAKFIILLFCSILLISCHLKDDPYDPVFEIFEDSDIVNIDLKNQIGIDLSTSDFIEEIKLNQKTNNLGTNIVIPIGSNIVSVASDNKTIRLVKATDNKILNEIAYLGRGPGEYQSIDGILHNGEEIFVIDNRLNKVILYDLQLNYIDEHYLEDLDTFSGLDVHAQYLLYPIRSNEDHLFTIKNLSSIEGSSNTFLNRIISLGKMPTNYNSFIPNISNTGSISLVSLHMPLIFYYQSINHSNLSNPDTIYRLKHNDLNIINKEVEYSQGMGNNIIQNPPPIDIERGNSRIGLTQLFNDIYHDDDWLFLVHSNNHLSIFDQNNANLSHVNTFYFKHPDNERFKIENITFSYPWIYLSSRFEDGFLKVNIDRLLNQ